MDQALLLARLAQSRGDWPVATVLVVDFEIVATGQGRQSTSRDPTWHAEMEAIRTAAERDIDLARATLYSTMEPCPMCAWAIHLSRIPRLVLGARHADLNRVDLGTYCLEGFAALMGYRMELVLGVRHRECVDLRLNWRGNAAAAN